MLLAACTPELSDNILESGGIVISADCQADTRSSFYSDLTVGWNKEDRLTVLSLDGTTAMVSEEAGADSPQCKFKVEDWPDEVTPRYAVFNGNSLEPSASINGRYIRTSINSVQKFYDDATFGKNDNLSIGELQLKENGSYKAMMKNVGGLVSFSLSKYDNIRSVILLDEGDDAAISGEFDIFMEDGTPLIKNVVNGCSYVSSSFDDEERTFRKGTKYYLCLRPDVDFTPIFVFITDKGCVMNYKWPETVRLRRSVVTDFGNVDSEAVDGGLYYISNENFGNESVADVSIWKSRLTSDCHPRLVFNSEDFEALKRQVGGNDATSGLHTCVMNVADETLNDASALEFVMDASNKRILDVSRKALARLVPCAYAYNMTGDGRYLQRAEEDLLSVCAFENWNPSHYLDVAEMSAAVSLAYDWLYHSLSESVKSEVVRALKSYALETSRRSTYTWWYDRIGNWNQVCNSGLVCAALAIYEHCPSLAQSVIDDAIATNRIAVEGIYGPDGAYPEGPTYWGYGTMYQVLMNACLESVLGTDYGLSSAPGFLETGTFKIFTRASSGYQFNFADNTASNNSNYPLYYFAFKNNNPSLLYTEMQLLENVTAYTNSEHKGLIPVAIKYAMDMNSAELQAPTDKYYSAQGETPVMMCRSGWEKNDHYLGIKGGQDGYLHGHMDGGTFVYYAHGVRWAIDLVRQSYTDVENGIAALGGKLSDYSQNSLRWRLFRLNCRQHNTLTVNDKDHNVDAFVAMTSTENTVGRMGATFDLTPLFDGDLVKAERTAALCNETYLEIKDVLEAPSDRSAHVRWTLVSKGTPEITSEGIVLSRNGVKMLLKSEGAAVTYRIWSADPQDYDSPLKHLDAANPDTYICGYEVQMPAGETMTITTTLKKI